MPDDPIPPEENKEPSQPESQPEEVKPVEENSQPDLSTDLSAKALAPVEASAKEEENPTPEPPEAAATSDVEETPVETPKEAEPRTDSQESGTVEPKPEQKAEESKPEEPKPSEEKKSEESKPSEEKKSEESKAPEPEVKIVEKEVIKEVKVADEEEVKKQVDDKLKEKLLDNKKKANEARIQRKKNNLDRIVDLTKKKEINNQDVRDLLQVSQSTATTYLTELAKSGRLKSEGKAKAKIYKS